MHTHRWSTREGTRGTRAFAHIYDQPDGTEYANLAAEAYWFSGAQHTRLAIRWTDEDQLQLSAGIEHVFSLWLTAGSRPLTRHLPWSRKAADTTVAEVTIHDGAIWWQFFADYFGNHPRYPRWRVGNWNPANTLLGRRVRTSEPIGEPQVVPVPMPEGCYQARVTFERNTWRRPRWPFEQTHTSYDITVLSRPGPEGPWLPMPDDQGNTPEGYIPVPGKGENAWDCGGDGTFSLAGPGNTPEQAIAALVQTCLRARRRHAGDLTYSDPI